ncbi:MAG TPA: hypothetical protein VEA37_12540, partial [Flavobacterium sp.]|nr:hypothetical protein [Flavobacterium sp.]
MRFHLLIAVLLLTTFSKAQQPFVQVQKSILIDREEFVRFGYLPKPTTVTTVIDRQPFSSKEEIESFVSNIISEHRADLPGAISSWIGQNLSSYDDGALIFIRHGFDLDKLFSNKHESIAKEYDEVCAKYNDAIGDLNTFRKDYDTLTANYRANQQKISSLESEIGELQEKSQTKTIKNQIASKQKEKTAVVLANAALIPRLNQLRSLIESHSKDAQTFFAEMKTLQKNYDEAKKFIIEDTGQVHQDILAMENYEWSDYLLNKRNIMLVVVGGSNTFKNYEVQITNRKKKYQEELTDLMQIVQYSGIPVPPSFDEKLLEGCEPAAGEPVKVPVTFVLIKRSRVDPPSSIELVQNKTVKHNLASIHEKSFVGIKVGVSLLSVDQKQFLIGANNKLNIEPDSLDAEEI